MSPTADDPRLGRAETYAVTTHRIYGDRRASPPKWELLLAVAHSTNVEPRVRAGLLELARPHQCPPVPTH